MKRIGGVILAMVCCLSLFGGCGKSRGEETITNRAIPLEDVTDFYYTYENINFNAYFQRYRFYREDGKYYFLHETRERPGQYGPATEADVKRAGTFEITAEEWKDFLAYLKDGTVSAKTDSAASGGSGPWTFLYWKNDKGRDRAFAFPDHDTRNRFEAFCASLAQGER